VEEVLSKEAVARAVYGAIRECAVTLRPDFRAAVERAREEASCQERDGGVSTADPRPGGAPSASRAAGVLDRILENAAIAAADGVPLCQDTGSVWVCLEV